MNLAGKDLQYYIEIVKIPIIVYACVSLLGVLASLLPGMLGLGLMGLVGLMGVIIGLGIIIYVGYAVIKKFKGNIIHAFFAGVVMGVIGSVIGFVINLVSIPIMASKTAALSTMGGAAAGALGFGGALLGLVLGLIFGSPITGGLCALVALIVKNV